MALTSEQHDLVETISRVLAADAEIEAAWLGGSLGGGGGDAFSDVDVVALVSPAAPAEVGLRYAQGGVAAIAEPALVNPLFGGRVVNVVATDWRRFDISFIGPGELGRFDAARLTVLFNRGDRAPAVAESSPYRTTHDAVLKLVNEFLRVLGLLAVVVGREEYVLGLSGTDLLRRLTIDLMLEENGVGPAERGGALLRNPLLTPEQRRQLDALSPVVADRAGLIASNAELAAIFLPRARRLAAEIGMDWPSILDAATRRCLRERLGLVID
jgi:hypothetical protein